MIVALPRDMNVSRQPSDRHPVEPDVTQARPVHGPDEDHVAAAHLLHQPEEAADRAEMDPLMRISLFLRKKKKGEAMNR